MFCTNPKTYSRTQKQISKPKIDNHTIFELTYLLLRSAVCFCVGINIQKNLLQIELTVGASYLYVSVQVAQLGPNAKFQPLLIYQLKLPLHVSKHGLLTTTANQVDNDANSSL